MKLRKDIPPAISAGKYLLDFSGRTLVMGILNVTPDSFSDGGRYFAKEKAVKHGLRMADEGADIIDIGGESTRPGSEAVSTEEELKRIVPVIEELSSMIDKPISIDTTKSAVVEAALDAGADIINDISGLRFDSNMALLAAKRDVPVIIMHIKGTPKDMQESPVYDDMMLEIKNYLESSIQIAVDAGVKKNNIIIDPGLGFGKPLNDNFSIIANLDYFYSLDAPILVGPSRKSFLWKTLGVSTDETIEATVAASSAAILGGADIIRVHDVKEVSAAVKIVDLIKNSDSGA